MTKRKKSQKRTTSQSSSDVDLPSELQILRAQVGLLERHWVTALSDPRVNDSPTFRLTQMSVEKLTNAAVRALTAANKSLEPFMLGE